MQTRIGARWAGTFAAALLAIAIWAAGAHAATPLAAARVGAAPAKQRLSLVLPLRIDESGLTSFATAVSTPGSPRYGDYESIPTLARRFGATAATRARVLSFLRRAGATGVSVNPTGLFASATMPVATAQRLFGAGLSQFRAHTAAGSEQTFVAPTAAARVPAAIAGDVTGVVGLDTETLSSTPEQSNAQSGDAVTPLTLDGGAGASADQPDLSGSAYTPRTGTPSGCPAGVAGTGFTPGQWNAAYGIVPLQEAGILGQGERVALIEIDGYKPSDIATWDQCFDVSVPHVDPFGVGIKKPLAPGGETTLDLEILSSVAQKLKGIDVYESHSLASDVLRALTVPLTVKHHHPDVISASLGSCEQATREALGQSGVNAVENSLKLAAADGVSVLAAAGDDGSTTCVNNEGPLPLAAVSYPASSRWVTGVGGTNVTLDANNAITGVTVWNDAPDSIGAGGGGFSRLFKAPSWQKPVAGGARHRIVPDVSMLGDPAPGYEVYCTAHSGQECLFSGNANPWIPYGGTSAGTPLLAGGLALVDQVLRRDHRKDIGFANPILYKLYRSGSGPSIFQDVTAGSDDMFATVGHPIGCCSAAPGFDAASGLGQVNVGALADAAPRVVARAAPKKKAKHKG